MLHQLKQTRDRFILLLAHAAMLLLLASSSLAEHRAALLIDNSAHADKAFTTPKPDLDALVAALGNYGVRCVIQRGIENEKQFRDVIDRFASNTPTASTAIVYFSGFVDEGKYNGKVTTVLATTQSRPDRGYPINKVLESLAERGGSRLNIVLVDAPKSSQHKHELADDCLIAFASHASLIKNLTGDEDMLDAIRNATPHHESTVSPGTSVGGKGSQAISPPNQFAFGKKAGDEWVDRSGAVFVWCPPGKYIKGSPPNEHGRYPDETQEEVVIKDGFWMSKYEMTLSENLRGRSHKTIAKKKNHPLTMVNFDDIRRMTMKTMTEAAQKSGALPNDWQYSLPTEDQWEYAARAGTSSMYYFGDDESKLPSHANFADKTYYDTGSVFAQRAHQTLDDGVPTLARVGQYKPNPWGLHDIHGNVAEWCLSGAIRGGSWVSTPANCRIAFRQHFSSRNEQNFIGYRLVIQKTPPIKKDQKRK